MRDLLEVPHPVNDEIHGDLPGIGGLGLFQLGKASPNLITNFMDLLVHCILLIRIADRLKVLL